MNDYMWYPKLLFIFTFALALGGCSEDDPVDTIRYNWPAWSASDSHVISLYSVNPQNLPASSPITFVLRDMKDGSEQQITVPKLDPSKPIRFWVSNQEDIILVGGGGLRAVDFQGNSINDLIKSVTGDTPDILAFSEHSNSYYWSAFETNRLLVGIGNNYAPSTFEPASEILLFDSLTNTQAVDIAETREGACAILLEDGSIIHITEPGQSTLLHTSAPITSGNISSERIKYLPSVSGQPSITSPDFVYFLDSDGVGRINLVNGEVQNLLSSADGNILSFDVEAVERTMLFVTSGKQVWLASENASPIQVLLYEHSMARFSQDGTSVVAVGYVNGAQDELRVLKFRQ